ncbi:hypothetical protein GCM10009528_13490 [Kineococcus aurantiacus]
MDRLVAVVLGLVLVLAGVAAAGWSTGWSDRWFPAVPDRVALPDVVGAPWWLVATAIGAVVLAVLALWWLLAHVPRRGVSTLTLPGSGPGGRLHVAVDGPVEAAAAQFALLPGVRSATGRALRDRGELVVELRAVVEPTADLREVSTAADEVSAQLRQVLGRDDVKGRVRLGVARDDRSRRVH